MHSKGGRPMRVWLLPGARAVFSSGMGEMLGLFMPPRYGPDGSESNPPCGDDAFHENELALSERAARAPGEAPDPSPLERLRAL